MTAIHDEIDLKQVFESIINFLARQFKIIFLTIAIGLGLGYSSFLAQKPTYKSTLIGNSEVLRNEYVTLLFKNLNDILAEGNSESVANYLQISTEVAAKIVKIEASAVSLKELKEANFQNLTNTFQIDILTLDPLILDSVQAGVIFYIQNNEFVKQKVALQKTFLENLISKIDFEILKMDTLRNKYNSKSIAITALDPSGINSSIINFYERKLGFQTQLATLNQVLVIQNFVKYNRPVSPKLAIYLTGGVSSTIVFGLLFIVFSEIRRKYKQIKSEKKL